MLLCLLSCFVKNDFLSNFSLHDNWTIIYDLNETDETKLFLHGIKFLLIVISITLHAMTVLGGVFSQPYGTVKEIEFSKFFQIFLSRSYLFADGMFFLGGFFAMFAWYDVIKSEKMKFNFKNFFVLRYFKIAIIATVIILITVLMPHLGSGPYYSDLTNHIKNNCVYNWWNIFLLISNEQRTLEMCIIPAWYLSSDFQIYILNYFVIYYLIMKPKLGFTLAFIQCCVVSAFNLFFIHHNNIPVIFNFFTMHIYDGSTFEDLYFHSFYHYNTYVLGLICAWTVKQQIKPKILNFKLVRFLITLVAGSAFYVFLVYLYNLEQTGNTEHNKYIQFFFPIIDKAINSIGPFWLFYSCCIGFSGKF